MRGSINGQVQQIWERSGINQIGQSRHLAKSVVAKTGITGSHEVAKLIGIHSFGTADAYREVWRCILAHAKDEFQLYDIEKISTVQVTSFLEQKIEEEVAYSTFAQYASAAEKLESALNRYSKKVGSGKSYSFDLAEVRTVGREVLPKFTKTRAYQNPEKLIAVLPSLEHQLVAKIQLEGGALAYALTYLLIQRVNQAVALEPGGVNHPLILQGNDIELAGEQGHACLGRNPDPSQNEAEEPRSSRA